MSAAMQCLYWMLLECMKSLWISSQQLLRQWCCLAADEDDDEDDDFLDDYLADKTAK